MWDEIKIICTLKEKKWSMNWIIFNRKISKHYLLSDFLPIIDGFSETQWEEGLTAHGFLETRASR